MDGVVPSITVESGNAAKEVVSPSVVDETVAKEKQSPLVNTSGLDRIHHYLHRKLPRLLMLPGGSSYARAMIKLRADVELKDNIVAAMPKITGEGYYACNIRVEYEWKPPRCACCKVFGHVQEEYPKNIGTGETKNLKKTSQTPKPTANASVSKKKNVESAKEVSKSNLFEVLTSVKNDMELGSNGGTLNLVSQASNSSGSSFWNVDVSSPSTTPIVEKSDKIEKLIMEGKVTLVDDEGKSLEKVASSCEFDSKNEVASVDNEMANFLAKKDGYGTQSLFEQWTESYKNGDYTMMICMKVLSSCVPSLKEVVCLCNGRRYETHPHPLYLTIFLA
ncbi:hypothetical protein Tco_1402311 [Tanacetum coccineum]